MEEKGGKGKNAFQKKISTRKKYVLKSLSILSMLSFDFQKKIQNVHSLCKVFHQRKLI